MISLLVRTISHLFNVKIGHRFRAKGFPIIVAKRGGILTIGNDVTLNSSLLSNLLGLYSRTIIVARTPGSIVHIGNHVGISGAAIYARNRIEIGDGTLLGANCKIMDNDFHPIGILDRNQNKESSIHSRAVVIGKNCFIGCNSLILKGTVLGDGCVVGAGAVVSGKFEAMKIIAGNPAKIIGEVK